MDSERIITAADYIQEVEQMEAEALAAYPEKIDGCSYGKGYTGQKVYVCRDCSKSDEVSGICYSCHTDHEILELSFKRDFRCDCGNSKMQNVCELQKEKAVTNESNQYNQNFYGKYCLCRQTYDPDLETRTMFQCYFCEDWYHDTCINAREQGFETYVCIACVEKFPWLADYHTAELEVTSPFASAKCKKPFPGSKHASHLFFPARLRDCLCQCSKCVELYDLNSLKFLFQEESALVSALDDPVTTYEAGLQAINQVDPSTVRNSMAALNKLQDNIKAFLRPFAAERKVVTAQDVEAFFREKMYQNATKH